MGSTCSAPNAVADADAAVLCIVWWAFSLGANLKALVEREDDVYVFRKQKDRVYYANERLLKAALSFGKKELVHVGVCLGKFTHSGKFHLHVTCLDLLAEYARFKVWVKPSAEMAFLYGNHVPKSGLARMTEGTPRYAGVIVLNMADVPLGFGVAAHSTDECVSLDQVANAVLHQGDVGEYLRTEDEITGVS